MQLEEADIQEFIELWEREFQEVLPLGEARAKASSLLELYAALARTRPSEQELTI